MAVSSQVNVISLHGRGVPTSPKQNDRSDLAFRLANSGDFLAAFAKIPNIARQSAAARLGPLRLY